MSMKVDDWRDERPDLAVTSVRCATCRNVVSLEEVFDGWALGRAHEECPRCFGALLPPAVPA